MPDRVTINAHSSIRIDGEKVMYFDPYLVKDEPHDADIIFFTHDHYDHLSGEDFVKYANSNTVFVAPKTCKEEALKNGVPCERLVTLEPGDKTEVEGVPIEAVASYNPGKDFHPKENRWLGYVVTVFGKRYYVTGDMDETPEALAVKCDVLLVPAGGTYTFDHAEAARFANKLKPKVAIPTHYGYVAGEKEDGKKFAQEVDSDIEVSLKLSF